LGYLTYLVASLIVEEIFKINKAKIWIWFLTLVLLVNLKAELNRETYRFDILVKIMEFVW
jgi:hypothetical protein